MDTWQAMRDALGDFGRYVREDSSGVNCNGVPVVNLDAAPNFQISVIAYPNHYDVMFWDDEYYSIGDYTVATFGEVLNIIKIGLGE